MPGTTHEILVGDVKDVTEVVATVNVVVYADGTADVEDELAFERLLAHRNGIVLAMHRASRILSEAKSPAAAAAELDREAKALDGKILVPNDPEAWESLHLKEVRDRIEREQPSLATLLTDEERVVAVAQPHAQLRRNRVAQ
jgi:hypothetical protein